MQGETGGEEVFCSVDGPIQEEWAEAVDGGGGSATRQGSDVCPCVPMCQALHESPPVL